LTTRYDMVAVGDKFPSVVAQSHEPSWPTAVKLTERLAGKKTIFVGLPGAFTPT
jgi:peroxiredoxin